LTGVRIGPLTVEGCKGVVGFSGENWLGVEGVDGIAIGVLGAFDIAVVDVGCISGALDFDFEFGMAVLGFGSEDLDLAFDLPMLVVGCVNGAFDLDDFAFDFNSLILLFVGGAVRVSDLGITVVRIGWSAVGCVGHELSIGAPCGILSLGISGELVGFEVGALV
jgi:hypothetical protein